MSVVITFSRYFPSYHPRKGEPTFFVEKIWTSLNIPFPESSTVTMLENINTIELGIKKLYAFINSLCLDEFDPKFHTIRAGKRWKVGDKFSPRVWSGKPYASKQIIIADDIKILKIWNFEIKNRELLFNGEILGSTANIDCSINDGLLYEDFLAWFKFPNPFSGQIIAWNENVKY